VYKKNGTKRYFKYCLEPRGLRNSPDTSTRSQPKLIPKKWRPSQQRARPVGCGPVARAWRQKMGRAGPPICRLSSTEAQRSRPPAQSPPPMAAAAHVPIVDLDDDDDLTVAAFSSPPSSRKRSYGVASASTPRLISSTPSRCLLHRPLPSTRSCC